MNDLTGQTLAGQFFLRELIGKYKMFEFRGR